MTSDELVSLIARGESSTFELKAGLPPLDLIAKILGSFANTEGGTIAFGIQEPRQIRGIDPAKAQKAIASAAQRLSPNQDVTVNVLDLDGKSVVLAHIRKSSELVAVRGAYYTRRADSTHPITAQEVRTHVAEAAPGKDTTAELAEAIAKQTATFEKLTADFAKANSMGRKIFYLAVGAVFGAIFKAVAAVLIGG